jgi:hypothetical protein
MAALPSALALDVRDDLRACFVVERSAQLHAFVAWASGGGPPPLPAALRGVVLARSSFAEPAISRFGAEFLSSFPLAAAAAAAAAPGEGANAGEAPCLPGLAASSRAVGICVTVVSRSFSPERHLTLAKALAEAYAAHGSGQHLQACWLSAFARGRVPRATTIFAGPLTTLPPMPAAPEGCAWDGAAFDASKSFRPTGARAVLAQLGVEAVLVWTALALRRRVAVVGRRHELARVVRAARVLALLVSHRLTRTDGAPGAPLAETPAAICWPYVALSAHAFAATADEPERAAAANRLSLEGPLGAAFVRAVDEAAAAQAEDLRAAATYVGGFTDPAALARGGDLWDVLVELRPDNLAAVSVHEAAKADFVMGPAHKEVARALLEALADPAGTDASAIAAVAAKGAALVDRLAVWFPRGVSSADPAAFFATTRANGVPKGATESFLFGFACAEPRLRLRA